MSAEIATVSYSNKASKSEVAIAEKEITPFVSAWKNTPKEQAIEEILSAAMESRRIPDYYPHKIRSDGKLVNPTTERLVEESILTHTLLYKKEYQAFQKIQDWAKNHDSGFLVWISPPHKDEKYNETKIVVSEIETIINDKSGEKEKLLANRAILVDADEIEAIKLANKFGAHSSTVGEFENEEDVRLNPIPLDNLSKNQWLTIAVSILKNKKIHKMIISGEDVNIKERARPKAEQFYSEMHLYRTNMDYLRERYFNEKLFGIHGGSCPSARGAFDTLFYSSSNVVETTFSCPSCKGEIISGLGITTCPHCRTRKEDIGSSCD